MSSVLLLIDSDLSKEEMAIAKHYPAHTALCIKMVGNSAPQTVLQVGFLRYMVIC